MTHGYTSCVRHSLGLGIALAVFVAACSSPSPIVPAPDVDDRDSTFSPADSGAWTPSAQPCATPGTTNTCKLEAYPDREYEVFLPSSYDPGIPIALVVAFHGGGGSAQHGATMSCPGGDVDDAGCLHNLGEREGFATVYPNGTGFLPLRRLRTWNAGGGAEGWNCASGKACGDDIDDLAYVDTLLEHLGSWLNLDGTRIYATGLSNGAAFSHRLACQGADTFAAIAAVAGSNQLSTAMSCEPSEPVAILQVHGTEDPCWTYETTDASCLGTGGRKLGATESIDEWTGILACDEPPYETTLPDTADDGMTTVSELWSGCSGDVDVQLLTIVGGGHTWPTGSPALSERLVGSITFDWGSEVLWDFLKSHRQAMPSR